MFDPATFGINDPVLQMLLQGVQPSQLNAAVNPLPQPGGQLGSARDTQLGAPHAAATPETRAPAPASAAGQPLAGRPQAQGGGFLEGLRGMDPANIFVAPGPLPMTPAPQAGGGIFKALAQGIGLFSQGVAARGQAGRQREAEGLEKRKGEAQITESGARVKESEANVARAAATTEREQFLTEESRAALTANAAAFDALDPETKERLFPGSGKLAGKDFARSLDTRQAIADAEDKIRAGRFTDAQIGSLSSESTVAKQETVTTIEKGIMAQMEAIDQLQHDLALQEAITKNPEQQAALLAANPFMTNNVDPDVLRKAIDFYQSMINYDIQRIAAIDPNAAILPLIKNQLGKGDTDSDALIKQFLSEAGIDVPTVKAADPVGANVGGDEGIFGADGLMTKIPGISPFFQFLGEIAEKTATGVTRGLSGGAQRGTEEMIDLYSNHPAVREATDFYTQKAIDQGMDPKKARKRAADTVAAKVVQAHDIEGGFAQGERGEDEPAEERGVKKPKPQISIFRRFAKAILQKDQDEESTP